jgi:SAM-dependent methyltransferase
MPSFDAVADEYDSGRPEYPGAVYDALGTIAGATVLEGGAGTGIATRALVGRGARVVAFDIGARLLRRAVEHTADLRAVVADGARLPFHDGCADLICFAQSWHWVDPTRRVPEAARVLRTGGRWAGWWSHARADDEDWFDAYWTAIERWCPGTRRSQRDTDWGDELGRSGLFVVDDRVTVPWLRRTTIDQWLTDQRSHSYVSALPDSERDRLMPVLSTILSQSFPSGVMEVRYETWLWIAHSRPSSPPGAVTPGERASPTEPGRRRGNPPSDLDAGPAPRRGG